MKTKVMGVLNVTPIAFSDGGHYVTPEQALAQALKMQEEGADIIDVGGESTRPGALAVSVDEELRRVIPVVKLLKQTLSIPVSVDTSKSQVMAQAIRARADVINDVTGLREEGAVDAVLNSDAQVILMHMQGSPRDMQLDPSYANPVEDVYRFLEERVNACVRAGLNRKRIMIDPGFGFGKSYEHNLSLLNNLGRFKSLEVPIAVGMSRKSMIADALGGAAASERLYGSISAAVIAAWQGADIVRVHDVRATVEALKVCDAVRAVPNDKVLN